MQVVDDHLNFCTYGGSSDVFLRFREANRISTAPCWSKGLPFCLKSYQRRSIRKEHSSRQQRSPQGKRFSDRSVFHPATREKKEEENIIYYASTFCKFHLIILQMINTQTSCAASSPQLLLNITLTGKSVTSVSKAEPQCSTCVVLRIFWHNHHLIQVIIFTSKALPDFSRKAALSLMHTPK